LAQETELGFQIASAFGEAASVFNRSMETINRFSGWEVPPLKDELAKLADQFQELRNRLEAFRDAVDGWKAGAIQTGVEAVLSRSREVRAPLIRVGKILEGTENSLAAKRRALMNLEATLLLDVDLGILGLTLLCPLLMAGQISLIWALGRLFRQAGKREA
jgi:hypothetical protein